MTNIYFCNIFNLEAQTLARQEKVERVDTIGELDHEYWKLEEQDKGNFLRIYPLFNTVKFKSSNPMDKVVEDNKCLICENKVNTVITCY